MKYILVFIIFISCSLKKQDNLYITKKVNTSESLISTNKEKTSEIRYEFIDTKWKDSSTITFLTFDFNLVNISDINEVSLISKKYQNISGPFIIGNILTDTCLIYPVFSKGKTEYFLIDDEINFNDSIITISYTIASGYYDQNNVIFYPEVKSLKLDQTSINLDSLKSISEKTYATKNWYRKWLQDHPFYQDERTVKYRTEKLCN